MKNIRYALASASYHKKSSIAIISVFFIFLILLTSLLNLIDINTYSYHQFEKFGFNSEAISQHKELLTSYYFIIGFTLFLFTILFIFCLFFSLKEKKQDLVKWRLMGFTTSTVIKQFLIEILVLLFISLCFVAIVTLVFQQTYETILVNSENFFTQSKIAEVPVFSSNAVIEHTPNLLVNSNKNIYFFDIEMNKLPIFMIIAALEKSSIIILFLTTSICFATLFLFFSRNNNIEAYQHLVN